MNPTPQSPTSDTNARRVVAKYDQAIQRVTNVRERSYLQTRAATIRTSAVDGEDER